MINVSFISLVNLIAGKEVIKELIQNEANAIAVSEELRNLVDNDHYRNKILNDYDSIIKLLDTGSASDNAARLMTQYLRN
jgi:lipid-A-disaccharide synthase